MADMNSVFLNQLFGNQAGVIGNDPSLNAFNRTIGQNDYWKLGGGTLGSAKFDTSTWNPATTAAVTGAQGFLSALLSGYGARQEAQQLDAVRAVLPQLRAGEDVALPDFVDPEAGAGLKLNITQENADRRAMAAAKSAERESDAAKILFQMGVQPVKDEAGKVSLQRIPGIAEAKGEAAKAEEAAKWGGDISKSPDSPENKLKSLNKAEEDAARNEIKADPSVTQLRMRDAVLPQLKAIKDLPTKTSDIPFVTLFLKSFDDSVVRAEEYARVASANGIVGQYEAVLKGALEGKGIDPKIKDQMYREIVQSRNGLLSAANVAAEDRLRLVAARGGDPKNAIPFTNKPIKLFQEPTDPEERAQFIDFAKKLRAAGQSRSAIEDLWIGE